MAWNIHASCYLSCATRDYSTCVYSTCDYYMHSQTCNSHEWNMYRHKHAINIHYSPASNLQKLVNSVHNSENYTRNVLINSRINYQGNGLILHVIKMLNKTPGV